MIKQVYQSPGSSQRTYASPTKLNSVINQSNILLRSDVPTVHNQMLSQSSPIKEIHYIDQPILVVPRNQLEEQYQIIIEKLEDEKSLLVRENIQLRSVQASEKLSIVEDVTIINYMRTENTKLIQSNKQLQYDLEDYKLKYVEFESKVSFQYGLEIDYMRLKQQLQETEIVLRAEIKHLQGVIEDHERKHHSTNAKHEGANSQNSHAAKSQVNRIRDLENKIAMFSTEFERMNMMVNSKNQDLDKWKKKHNEAELLGLDKDLQTSQLNVEINRLKALIDQRNAEISLLKQKNIDPAEFQNRIRQLQQEQEQLLTNLKVKSEESDRYRQEMTHLSSQLKDGSRYKELTDKIFHLEGELQRANRTVKDQDAEIERLLNKIKDLEQEMDESSYKEEKVTYLTSEVDTWKKKFTALNKEFHETQEKLMLTQAELDSQLHKGSTTMRIETTTTRKSQMMNDHHTMK